MTQYEHIVELRGKGLTYSQIGRKLGISKGSAAYIVYKNKNPERIRAAQKAFTKRLRLEAEQRRQKWLRIAQEAIQDP